MGLVSESGLGLAADHVGGGSVLHAALVQNQTGQLVVHAVAIPVEAAGEPFTL